MKKTRITIDLSVNLAKEIKNHLKGNSKYPNMSEFVRDAIREKISFDNLPFVGPHRFLEIKHRVFYGKTKYLDGTAVPDDSEIERTIRQDKKDLSAMEKRLRRIQKSKRIFFGVSSKSLKDLCHLTFDKPYS